MIILALVVFILILGLLIFVHEAGHFFMAKKAGMRVEEFGFGFPPRIFGIRRGETIYSINWIPLGGFVRILGEDGGTSSDPKAFSNKGFGARFLVLVAGVAMNLFLGWFLLFLGFAVIGAPTEISPGLTLSGARVSQKHITIVQVDKDSPAQYAGFKAGDVILGINGKQFDDIEQMITYTKSLAGSKATYELKRGSELLHRDVTPRVNPPVGSGPVGFSPAQIAEVRYSVLQALSLSLSSFVDRTWGILAAFGVLLKGIFTSGKLAAGLSGPVGIAVMTRDFTRLGLVYLVQFAAVLSINLGIINAIPFPALDGGRIFFLLIEKIRGVRSMKWERIANTAGFLLLLLLMVAVTFRDVGRFSEQFKRLFEKLI